MREKAHNFCFYLRIGWHGTFGLPYQTRRERRLYRRIFEFMARRGDLDIFEWGSGLSTIYYARWLTKCGFSFTWRAVDNNAVWCDKIRRMVDKHGLQDVVKVDCQEFLPFWEKPAWDWGKLPPPCGIFSPRLPAELDYIAWPKKIGGRYDIVFIDGRFRRHCLGTARDILKPGGLIVMHDAQKTQYHPGTETFLHSRFFEGGAWTPFTDNRARVWVGSLDNMGFLESLKNF